MKTYLQLFLLLMLELTSPSVKQPSSSQKMVCRFKGGSLLSALLSPVVPSISFSTENVVVGEGDGSAEVCLDLSVPLSTDLQVVVSASAGTGIILHIRVSFPSLG